MPCAHRLTALRWVRERDLRVERSSVWVALLRRRVRRWFRVDRKDALRDTHEEWRQLNELQGKELDDG